MQQKEREFAMHDMTAKKAAMTPAGQHPKFQKHHKRFPTTAWLRRRAPNNVPLFAFEYGDTGAGNDVGIAHNWAAFDAIEIVPRYGVMPSLPPVDVKLFGQQLFSADRHRADGRPVTGLAGRRSADGESGATRTHSLHAERRGRRTIEQVGGGRARCVLAPALSVLARRSQDWLRSPAARAGGRGQGARADA